MTIILQESLRGLFYAPYYAAFALGAYEAEGVDVRFAAAPGFGNAPNGLFDGSTDVAWGGPIWGSLIPLAAYGLAGLRRWRSRRLLCFFAGFCLLVNGLYIGVGWTTAAGDAGALLRHGASPWVMAVGGLTAAAAGLYLWHRLGSTGTPSTG